MRARLAYTLSYWLLGAVLLSVLAMGGLSAWNLRQGFSDYLRARDLERLDSFVTLVQAALAPGSPTAGAGAPDMPSLLRQLAVLEGTVRPGARPPDAPEPGGPPPRRMGPPPGGGDRFGERVALALPDGSHWAGPPIAADAPGVVERAVVAGGSVRALVRLRPLQRAPEDSEARFLRSQYIGIAAMAAALMLLALGAAVWLARQWVRPLAAMQAATARIAQGELGVRVPVEREDEIGDLVRNVNSMAASLQRMEGARRRWLADLSHELRTPLTVLRGDIEALVDGVRPLQPSAVAGLRDDVLRLGSLVDDLHLLAMADLQTLPCRMVDDDAVRLVQAALDRHAPRAAEAGLSLAWAAKPPVVLPVCWDAGRIAQLLANLIQNSLRYTDAPGRITLALQAASGRVTLQLDDSAPGAQPDDLPRLFEPLFRADSARSRHDGGSGLGLAICAAIVRAHGGHIGASASALGGLRITVTLPAMADTPTA